MPPTRTDRQLSVTEHLEELRRRLGICLVALLVAVGVSATQVEWLIQWLQRPAQPWLLRFAYFRLTEPLVAYIKVSVLAGIVLTMPVILWQVWAFIRAGLKPKERRLGLAFIWWGSALFAAGVAFAYVVLLPVAVRVLFGIGQDLLEPVISIDAYLSFVTGLTLSCGLIFELPAVIFLLAKVGVVTPEWLRQQRPYAILVLVIMAALITPTTDPVNLLLLAVPMVALYELSIILARYAVRRAPGSSSARSPARLPTPQPR